MPFNAPEVSVHDPDWVAGLARRLQQLEGELPAEKESDPRWPPRIEPPAGDPAAEVVLIVDDAPEVDLTLVEGESYAESVEAARLEVDRRLNDLLLRQKSFSAQVRRMRSELLVVAEGLGKILEAPPAEDEVNPAVDDETDLERAKLLVLMAERMGEDAFTIRSFHEKTKLDGNVAATLVPFLAGVPWEGSDAVTKLGYAVRSFRGAAYGGLKLERDNGKARDGQVYRVVRA